MTGTGSGRENQNPVLPGGTPSPLRGGRDGSPHARGWALSAPRSHNGEAQWGRRGGCRPPGSHPQRAHAGCHAGAVTPFWSLAHRGGEAGGRDAVGLDRESGVFGETDAQPQCPLCPAETAMGGPSRNQGTAQLPAKSPLPEPGQNGSPAPGPQSCRWHRHGAGGGLGGSRTRRLAQAQCKPWPAAPPPAVASSGRGAGAGAGPAGGARAAPGRSPQPRSAAPAAPLGSSWAAAHRRHRPQLEPITPPAPLGTARLISDPL